MCKDECQNGFTVCCLECERADTCDVKCDEYDEVEIAEFCVRYFKGGDTIAQD